MSRPIPDPTPAPPDAGNSDRRSGYAHDRQGSGALPSPQRLADPAMRVASERSRAFWQGPLPPITALLPPGVDPKRLRQMPPALRRPYVRAVRGEASLREAVRAFCAECCGYDRDAVRTCPAVACQLHPYRPWQRTRKGRSTKRNAPATEAPTRQTDGGSDE